MQNLTILVSGSIVLCEEVARADVNPLVFSSSDPVYADPKSVPIREDFLLGTTNPYGQSKFVVENILADLH